MKKVEVFGTGCKKCMSTKDIIENKAKEMGTEIDLHHISDPVEMASRGIISAPAIMIDGKLVHKHGIPSEADIKEWLK